MREFGDRDTSRRSVLKSIGGAIAGAAGVSVLSGRSAAASSNAPDKIYLDLYADDNVNNDSRISNIKGAAKDFCYFLRENGMYASVWDYTDESLPAIPGGGDRSGWADFSNNDLNWNGKNVFQVVIINKPSFAGYSLGWNPHRWDGDYATEGAISYVNTNPLAGAVDSLVEPITVHEILHAFGDDGGGDWIKHEDGTFDTDGSWYARPSIMGAGYTLDWKDIANENPDNDWQNRDWQDYAWPWRVQHTMKMSRATMTKLVDFLPIGYPDNFSYSKDYYDLTAY